MGKLPFKKFIFVFLILSTALGSIWIGVKPRKDMINHIESDELLNIYYMGAFKTVFITHNYPPKLLNSDLKYGAVPVAGYLGALTLYLSPFRYMLKEPTEFWLFTNRNNMPDLNSDQDIKQHPLPYAREMVHILRSKLLVFRAACCMILFIIAWYLGRYYCALPTIFFILTDKYFIEISSLVQAEIIWLSQHFLNLLLIFIYLSLWQKEKRNQVQLILITTLIGITTGLLTATKIHGILNLIIYLVCFMSVLILQIIHKKTAKKIFLTGIIHMFIATSLCLFIFIIVNPALHTHPIYGIKQIVIQRINSFSTQIKVQPFWHLPNVTSRLNFIVHIVNFSKIKILFFITGIYFIFHEIKNYFFEKEQLGISYILTIAFIVEFLAILKYMLMSYDRYVLVLLPYIYLAISYGAYRLLNLVFLKIKNHKINFP